VGRPIDGGSIPDRRLPDGWERDGDELLRVCRFDDYLDGVTVATRIAAVADEEFHHPQ
jgi:4a-hydroxytetrahydrobiopterin dehydratase